MRRAFGGVVILCSERQWGHFEGIVEPRQGGGGVAKSQSSLMPATLLELHCELNTNEFSAVVFSQTCLNCLEWAAGGRTLCTVICPLSRRSPTLVSSNG